MTRIFVSYRRDDTEGEAGRVADRLISRFGADQVFYDRESLRPGDLWRQRIDDELAGCELMLVLIGPRWESLAGADGRPRLFDPDDVTAYEIVTALKRGIRLVPLLVRRQQLPAAADLPPALAAVRDSQAPVLHADAFGPVIDALIDSFDPGGAARPAAGRSPRGLAGPTAAPPSAKTWVWGAAVAGGLTLAAALVLGLNRNGGAPAAPAVATPVQMSGQLQLRLRLAPEAAGEAPLPASAAAGQQNVLMAVIDPIESVIELPAPVQARDRAFDFVIPRALLPLAGQRYEADLTRRVQSAHQGPPRRTTLCLQRTPTAPPDGLRAVVACDEGQRCQVGEGNPGHFVASCGVPPAAAPAPRKAAALDWLALPGAYAQTAPAAVSAAASAPAAAVPGKVWSIPSIDTLLRSEQAGAAGAFTEVFLVSPPLPALRAARRVSLEIVVNGQPAWIDGLPPQSYPLPFDAEQGLNLRFGLENLGFSGANMGTEKLSLRLRFLDGKTVLREWQADLKYVALRPKPQPRVVGDPELGIAWTASYHPGSSADRWQIFLASTRASEGLDQARLRFDAAQHTIALAGQTYPLVAVIRPPLEGGANWGLNVGVKQPSGQIRFSFDDTLSQQLCRRLVQLSADPRQGVQRDTFRRRIDSKAGSNPCREVASR